MRAVFTGGGTGGHLFPNMAVIEELKNRDGIFYIGQKGGFEQAVCEQAGIPFFGIYAGKLRRYFDFRNFIDFFKMPAGFLQAYFILKKLKPKLVFAKGGYVSVPVVIAASALKIPVWLHESDITPGLANKICAKFAQKIFLSFEESRLFFPGRDNVKIVGNPVRREIAAGRAEAGYKLTGFNKHKPIVLIMGGSSGAAGLNALVFKTCHPEPCHPEPCHPELCHPELCHPELAEGCHPRPDRESTLLKTAQIIHITGTLSLETSAACAALTSKNYRHFDFLQARNLADCYAIADLVVTRAGSGAIFESLACNKPMILIPLPVSASRGDQVQNAQAAARMGWAKMLCQEDLTADKLNREIASLLADKKALAEMRSRGAKQKFSAAEKIAEEINSFI